MSGEFRSPSYPWTEKSLLKAEKQLGGQRDCMQKAKGNHCSKTSEDNLICTVPCRGTCRDKNAEVKFCIPLKMWCL